MIRRFHIGVALLGGVYCNVIPILGCQFNKGDKSWKTLPFLRKKQVVRQTGSMERIYSGMAVGGERLLLGGCYSLLGLVLPILLMRIQYGFAHQLLARRSWLWRRTFLALW